MLTATLLLTVLPALAAAPSGPAADYVEARTASVYAGACHAAGEYTTQGREAVLAWRFAPGARDAAGVDLSGAVVVAVLAADRNLAEDGARTRSVLYADASADPRVRAAAVAAVRAAFPARLGRVAEVRTAPLDFALDGEAFRVAAGDEVELRGTTLPDRQCCKMPFDRWYEPFAAPLPETPAVVGNCDLFRVADETLGRSFARRGENNAFLSRVALPPAGAAVAAR